MLNFGFLSYNKLRQRTLVFYNCLPVHNTTTNKSQAQKSWAGVFENFEFSVMNDQEYGDNTGDSTEQGNAQQNQPKHSLIDG